MLVVCSWRSPVSRLPHYCCVQKPGRTSGALLYSYDQDKVLEREATVKAFELAPHNWQAIVRYLGQFGEEMSPEVKIELIERISQSNPDHPVAYYNQARYFEEYASLSKETRYWNAAIKAYQVFLAMAARIPQSVPSRVVEEKIKRINDMLADSSEDTH